MINFLKSHFIKVNQINNDRLEIIKLVVGSAFSQLISVLIAPLLAYLYTPNDFGALATYMSVLTVFSIFSAFGLEAAITIPEKKNDYLMLGIICIEIILIFCFITPIFIIIFRNFIKLYINQEMISIFIFLLPFGLLFRGIFKVSNYLILREQDYNSIVVGKIGQSTIGAILGLFLSYFGAFGLIVGEIFRQSSAGFFLIIKSFIRNKKILKKISQKKINIALKKFKSFGFFNSQAGIINTIGYEFPIMILALHFDISKVGLYYMAQKLLSTPLLLFGNSISQVFIGKAPNYFRNKNFYPFLRSKYRQILLLTIFLALILILILPIIINLFLGDEWKLTIKIIYLISPMVFVDFYVSTLSPTFLIINKPKEGLYAQIILFVTRVLPLFFAINLLNLKFEMSIFIYSLSSVFGYCFYYYFLIKTAKKF